MMEIAFGPVVLWCAVESLAVGIAAALLLPLLIPATSRLRLHGLKGRLGLMLLTGGLFGLGHLALFCAADGFPPRIIQSTAVALALTAAAGAAMLARRTRGIATA